MIKIQVKSPDLDIRMSTDESVFIKESRDDVINSLILGALLAGLVVLFSFGDLRNTIITIAGLPVCIIGTFAIMSLLGFTMNVITLLALSLIVGANLLQGTALNEVQQNVITKLQTVNLPSDVTFDFGGQVEQTSEQFQSLFISLILAIIFVYMVLASQFGSFLQPFAIMLALPLSIIGAVLGLLIANKLFDMVAFIGLIMLMGLVTKNSILLIDYTNVLRRRGLNKLEAIIEAGATRLRPILMTSFAMILGMIPVAFGFGTSSDFRAPIGFTIIGGLISSTLLTLVVVPVVYSIIDDISLKVRRKK